MEQRLVRAASERGVSAPDLERVVKAHRAAMAIRDSPFSTLSSDQDPAYLHPGRVVLILLQDLEEGDPDALAVGALAESRAPALSVSATAAEEVLGESAFALWTALPEVSWGGATGPDDDGELLEDLVTADAVVQRIALAEALDQLRHAHLWENAAERVRAAQVAREVLAPAAARVHPVLERRFNWWVRRVGDSFKFGRK